jgi:2-phospho-L-lactate guanylyltransferase
VPDWTVVVPVKGTVSAKSRLAATPELALAIALDSVAAAAAVAHIIVVTSPGVAHEFEHLGATVVHDSDAGLNAAALQGIATAPPGPVAVLLGDVPALQPAELAAALRLAQQHPLAFVADADDEGSVLITALDAADHRPAFGRLSRAAHLAAGYVELNIPAGSGLRRDVDTPAQLAALAARVGSRTRAALERASSRRGPRLAGD